MTESKFMSEPGTIRLIQQIKSMPDQITIDYDETDGLHVIDGSITANKLANDAVTTDKIADFAELRGEMGLGNTLGPLPVENGGTGATSAEEAIVNLGIDQYVSNQIASSMNSNGGDEMQYVTSYSEKGSGRSSSSSEWNKMIPKNFPSSLNENFPKDINRLEHITPGWFGFVGTLDSAKDEYTSFSAFSLRNVGYYKVDFYYSLSMVLSSGPTSERDFIQYDIQMGNSGPTVINDRRVYANSNLDFSDSIHLSFIYNCRDLNLLTYFCTVNVLASFNKNQAMGSSSFTQSVNFNYLGLNIPEQYKELPVFNDVNKEYTEI